MLAVNRKPASALRTTLLRDAHEFARISGPLSELRENLCSRHCIFFDPDYFFTCTDSVRRPCAVACWRDDETLAGILFAVQHYVCGIRTGYALAGDYSGRGALLAAEEDRTVVAQAAVEALARHGVHSIHFRISPALHRELDVDGFAWHHLRDTVPGDHLPLAPTFEEFLSSLGKHTRRNIRHYLRRAQEQGFVFCSDMPMTEYIAGVRALNRLTAFPIVERRIARDMRLVQRFDGQHFALRDSSGDVIAALCGFSLNGCFHLLSQVNHAGMLHHSLSLVLRGLTIEHLIATGHSDLQFMGGTSLMLGRFCEPIEFQSFVLDKRRSLVNPIKQLAARIVASRAQRGKSSPVSLQIFAGSFLDTEHIIDRTPLRPALALRNKTSAAAMPDAGPEWVRYPNVTATSGMLHPQPVISPMRRGA